jgi:hypothetical protein
MHSFIEVKKMLKRRGNFPYDFDAAYPDHPTPVMPQNPIQYSATVPTSAKDHALSAPSALVPSATEGHPPTPAAPPKLRKEAKKSEAHKSSARRRRRTRPLQRASSKNFALAAPPPTESEASHHSRKCTICHHPDRAAIEDDFVNWINISDISLEFDVPERSIRCHSRATRLYERRRAKYHAALDLIIEDASQVLSTGDTIIRAIRAASCLDDSGRWVEPPKRVIFTTEHAYAPALPPHPPAPNFAPAKENPILELARPATNEAVLIGPGDD